MANPLEPYHHPTIPLTGAHRGRDYEQTEREYEGNDDDE